MSFPVREVYRDISLLALKMLKKESAPSDSVRSLPCAAAAPCILAALGSPPPRGAEGAGCGWDLALTGLEFRV